jgi:hypothetical protein
VADGGGHGERIGRIWRVSHYLILNWIPSLSSAARLATAGCVCCVMVGDGPRRLLSQRVCRLRTVSTIVAFASVSDSRPATK